METKKWKNKNFWEALMNSLHGMKYAIHQERNLKIQGILAIFAIGMGVFLKLSYLEWILLCLTIGMVLFAELMNTAVELLLDLYSQKYDEQIKFAKDVASSAVLLISVVSIVVGGILFLPKIVDKLM